MSSGRWPTTLERNTHGVLTVGCCDVNDLAEQFGTPLCVIDERDFRSMASWFRAEFFDAFEWHDLEVDVYYASHALLTSRIARWMRYEELGLAVASGGELEMALRGGMPAESIALHGNNKSDAELRRALEVGVGRIVVDSMTEIDTLNALAAELGVVAPVMVRVATGVRASGYEYVATEYDDQPFALSLAGSVAMDALKACHSSPHLELLGIHTHIGSQILTIEAFTKSATRMLTLRAAFINQTDADLPEVSLGGGFAMPGTTHAEEHEFAIAPHTIANALYRSLNEIGGGRPRISIEPGRAIVGSAGLTLYRVGVVKHVALSTGGKRQYVAVDAGLGNAIGATTLSTDGAATLASRPAGQNFVISRVVGKHCESEDILIRDIQLPVDIARGDLLAIPATGAYGRPMASNYNMLMRPPVISVRDGVATAHIRRDTIEDLLSWDIAPD